jgi:hypothetical protein
MVDLHPGEPAVEADHPWLGFSRWSMVWRVWLTGAAVAATVVLLFTLGSVIERQRVSLIEVPLGWAAVTLIEVPLGWAAVTLLPLVVFATATALLGRWLRRFNSLTQTLVFGAICVMSLWLVVLVVDVATTLTRACEPNTYCSRPGEATIWVTYLYLGPTFVIAVVSYGLTLWASRNVRRQRVSVIVAGVILTMFLALAVAAATGAFTTVPAQNQPVRSHDGELLPFGMCPDYDAQGNPVTVQCLPE